MEQKWTCSIADMYCESWRNRTLPDPGYTDYLAGVMLADAKPVPLELEPPDYLPDWNKIDPQTLKETKLIYLTYPNNPTGSTATQSVFDEAIEKFKDTDTKIVHDFAYSAFGFDAKNPSILASKDGKEVAIEIFSLSKGYNMSGFRVGFAVGNKEMIQALKSIKHIRMQECSSTARCCNICAQSL